MTAVYPLSTAVVDALTAAGLSVYRNAGPKDPESSVPYVLVYTQAPQTSGPTGSPNADGRFTVQLKYVSNGAGGCEATGDKARSAILAMTAPAGYVLAGPVRPLGGEPAREDPDTTGPLWMADELFSVAVTPE